VVAAPKARLACTTAARLRSRFPTGRRRIALRRSPLCARRADESTRQGARAPGQEASGGGQMTQTAVGEVMAAAKGPLHMIRGSGEQEKMTTSTSSSTQPTSRSRTGLVVRVSATLADAGGVCLLAFLPDAAHRRSARTSAARGRRRELGVPRSPVRPRRWSWRESRGRCKAGWSRSRAHRSDDLAAAACSVQEVTQRQV
jgi:hypothetical protein